LDYLQTYFSFQVGWRPDRLKTKSVQDQDFLLMLSIWKHALLLPISILQIATGLKPAWS